MSEYELYHHGIKGMKWGIRRFQNKNGRLTDAGKKRYSDDARRSKELSKKSRDEMSNAELRQYNERRQLERNYDQLNPGKIKAGMNYVATAAVATTTILTLYNNSEKLIKLGSKVANKIIKK